jgi:hypothetical protein
MNLTICYVTGRKDPKAEWFFDSLHRETGGDYSGIEIVVVDFWAEAQKPSDPWDVFDAAARLRGWLHVLRRALPVARVSAPCGNVWQGPCRLTRENFFAKSNTLNTAIMLSRGPWIAMCDDLSVLMPGWLKAVRRAQDENYILCGTYEKRKNMVVENGEIISSTDHPPGHDHRRAYAKDGQPIPAHASWFYGCSFAAPIEALLVVNGYPLDCDSMGYEDSVMGRTIAKHGYRMVLDPSALSVESEEDHHTGVQMRRVDPGISPRDKSHRMLEMYANVTRFDNYYGEEGLRGVRERVLAGAPLPVIRVPDREWFTGQLLSEFGQDLPIIDTKT